MAVDRAQLAKRRAEAEARVRALKDRPTPTVTVPTLPTLPTLPTVPTVPTVPPITDLRVLKMRADRRRQRQQLLSLVLVAVLALLLLRFCECEPEPVPVEPVAELICPDVPECPTGPARPPKKPTTKKKPLRGTSLKQDRDLLAVPTSRSPAWLAALRLQVTARSLPLAVCFNGTDKPGALRWTTTVTPSSGAVSDSELTPVLKGPALTAAQEQCVLGVLSTSPYRLGTEDDDDVGTRVSLILEF